MDHERMMVSCMDMQEDVFLKRIVDWATQNDNIIAVVQTGSHTRNDGKADQYSDYDIELIARDRSQLAQSDDWFRQFGSVWVCQSFDEGQDNPTRLVLYAGGVKVDFTLAEESRITAMSSDLDDLYQRGYKVLLDKDGITKQLPEPAGKLPERAVPTEAEYQDVVNEFWFEAWHIPKYLVRGDLWVVKFRDWTMKEMLLKMLEWYAVTQPNQSSDVWHIGTHMKDWLDPDIRERLNGIFAHFDAADSWTALLAQLDLFRDVSRQVADRLGYTYPEYMDQNIRGYIMEFEDRI